MHVRIRWNALRNCLFLFPFGHAATVADVSIDIVNCLLPVCSHANDSIVYSHGWADGTRLEEMEKTFSRNPSADTLITGMMEFSVKENDNFRIISRMDSKLERSRFSSRSINEIYPTIIQRKLVCCSRRSWWKHACWGSLAIFGNRTIDGTAELAIYRRWCVLFLLSWQGILLFSSSSFSFRRRIGF